MKFQEFTYSILFPSLKEDRGLTTGWPLQFSFLPSYNAGAGDSPQVQPRHIPETQLVGSCTTFVKLGFHREAEEYSYQ